MMTPACTGGATEARNGNRTERRLCYCYNPVSWRTLVVALSEFTMSNPRRQLPPHAHVSGVNEPVSIHDEEHLSHKLQPPLTLRGEASGRDLELGWERDRVVQPQRNRARRYPGHPSTLVLWSPGAPGEENAGASVRM